MRDGLDKGRQQGYVGWDKYWEDTTFPMPVRQWFMMRLHQEIDELVISLFTKKRNPEQIFKEAADVANFAMMIADIYGEYNDQ